MSRAALWDDLQSREIVHQTTSEEMGAWLSSRIASPEGLTAYAGFDPTADSLHVGSLMVTVGLRRLKRAGVKPIALVGGATGRIGDPSGKSAERQLLDEDALAHNVAGIAAQLEHLLEGSVGKDFLLLDNADWFRPITFLDFLRDVGKLITVNQMVAKESVRSRLEDREHGISYTEFSYMLLQAYDFYHLYHTQGCRLQVGGSDQWGNITAGIDLIKRKIEKADPQGMTFHLITTSSGQKFGKSEQGTIWLDRRRTHPYFFYKYFFHATDADVVRFLNYFSFRPREELDALATELREAPHLRACQKALAHDVTELVHGTAAAEACAGLEVAMHTDDTDAFEQHAAGLDLLDPAGLSQADQEGGELPVAHRPLKALAGDGLKLADLAVEIGLFGSKSEVRRELKSGSNAFRIGGEPITDFDQTLTADDLGSRRVIQLRKGKKNKRMVCFYEG